MWIKNIVTKGILILFYPVGLICNLEKKITRRNDLYEIFSHIFSLLPGIIGRYCLKAFYYNTLAEFHEDCRVHFGTIITNPNTIIKKNVAITVKCSIGLCTIGEGTVIANNVCVMSGRYQHKFESSGLNLADPSNFVGIKIGKKSFIGNNSLIMANVGDHCIVGAGSVVVKDIDSYSVAVGNPAKIIKKIDF